MLTGLGFSPFFAAGICLLANTAPVAFGSIGIPVITLAGTTGIDKIELSAWVGRLCAPISLFIPAYLILVMGGVKGLKGVLPAAIVCGVCFASVQFMMSNFVGPELVDIVASITAIVGLVLLFKVWQPKDRFVLAGEHHATVTLKSHGFSRTLLAWSPYLFLVVFVLLWGYPEHRGHPRQGKPPDTVAGPAQPNHPRPAGRRDSVRVRRDLQLQLARSRGYRVRVRDDRVRVHAARLRRHVFRAARRRSRSSSASRSSRLPACSVSRI